MNYEANNPPNPDALDTMDSWGEPCKMVDAFRPRPPVLWRIQQLIQEDSFNLLFGDPGSGKSLVAQYWALCVALGRPVFPPHPDEDTGEDTGHAVIQCPSAYVSVDMDERRIHDRTMFLARGLGVSDEEIANCPFYYWGVSPDRKVRLNVLNSTDMALLKHRVRKYGIRFLVIDILARISGGAPENDNSAMDMVMDQLRALSVQCQCAVIIIHHARKKSKDGSNAAVDMSRGATTIMGSVDRAYTLSKGSDSTWTLATGKSRDEEQDAVNFQWVYDKGEDDVTTRGTFYGIEPGIPKMMREGVIADAIIGCIAENHPDSGRRLVALAIEELNLNSGMKVSERTVRDAIGKLMKARRIGKRTGGARGSNTYFVLDTSPSNGE